MDPSLGRFTSPDTLVPTGTQGTQAWDRYAFVNNNPVRYNDPTGHKVEDDEGKSESEDDNQGEPPPPLSDLCGTKDKMGCTLNGTMMTMWLDGQTITIDVDSLSNTEMLHLIDFANTTNNYETSMDNLPVDILVTAGTFTAGVIILGLALFTSPADIVPVGGQIKFGAEILAGTITLGVSVLGGIKTAYDGYTLFTSVSGADEKFQYLQSLATTP